MPSIPKPCQSFIKTKKKKKVCGVVVMVADSCVWCNSVLVFVGFFVGFLGFFFDLCPEVCHCYYTEKEFMS